MTTPHTPTIDGPTRRSAACLWRAVLATDGTIVQRKVNHNGNV